MLGSRLLFRALAILLALPTFTPVGWTQDDPGTTDPASPGPDQTAVGERPRQTGQPVSPLSGEASVTGVYDTNVNRDEEDELSGRGGIVSLAGLYRGGPPLSDLYVRGAVARHQYDEPERWNRFSASLYTSVQVPVAGGVTLEPSASVLLGTITTEYRRANQLTVRSRLEVQAGRRDRIRPFIAYRYRWYQDPEGTTAFSPYAGVDYRRRWGSWHYADVDLQVEQNRAEVLVRRYTRSTAAVSYTRPLTRETRVRPALTLRRWWYEGAATPDPGERRRDWRLTPGVELLHDLARGLRVEGAYRYDVRESNDERRDFAGHRFNASLRYTW